TQPRSPAPTEGGARPAPCRESLWRPLPPRACPQAPPLSHTLASTEERVRPWLDGKRLRQRQGERERRPATKLRVHGHVAAHHAYILFHERKSEARTAQTVGRHTSCPPEGVERPVGLVGGQPCPFVGHLDAHDTTDRRAPHDDASPGLRVLHSVREQVGERAAQQYRV